MSLLNTKGYLQSAIVKGVEGGISLESLKQGNHTSFFKMLTEAFLHMVENAKNPEMVIPETFSFDAIHITAISHELNNMALVCTALTASNMHFGKIYTPMATASGSSKYASDAVSVTMDFVAGIERKIKDFHEGNFEEVTYPFFFLLKKKCVGIDLNFSRRLWRGSSRPSST